MLSGLGSGPGGLSSAVAAQRLGQLGPNLLGTHRVRPSAVLFRQVRNPILILLLGAALVSGLTGGGTNALIIAVIVAQSVGLGFFNEYRAETAMAALRAQIRQDAEVRRDGKPGRVPVADLVPGDVASLRAGALVPADLRLIEADELECDEGVLTGESMPVAKSPAAVGREPQDQPGCAFMGTIVHQGSGTGVVAVTGVRTEFGSPPAIVTVSLSAGSKALAANKVLVKRLVAIEDLGNIEILFTDRTGTLTEGVVTFDRALDSSGS